MDREVIAIGKGGEAYGVVIDIGTSKVVLHLVDLISGKTMSVKSVENPQIAYGEDVISRINYAAFKENGLKRLQELVIESINSLIEEACRETGVGQDRIYEVAVAGNTAMPHIFLGYPQAVSRGTLRRNREALSQCESGQLGLKVNRLANVYVLPEANRNYPSLP